MTNTVSATAAFSAIGSGNGNTVVYDHAYVGSGSENSASSASFVGAGASNSSAVTSYVGGGENNGDYYLASVGGGKSNGAGGLGSAVVGGANNLSIAGDFGLCLGGFGNLSGFSYSSTMGGYENSALHDSFAASYGAGRMQSTGFLWLDSAPGKPLPPPPPMPPRTFVVRVSGGVVFLSSKSGRSGVRLAPGSGTWSSLSDRSQKTGVAALDPVSILDKVLELPVTMWSYASERGVRHGGPMAQDFYAAFHLGENDRHIPTIDEDGVVLVAIKALSAQNAAALAEETDLGRTLARIHASHEVRFAAIERSIEAIKYRRRACHRTRSRGCRRTR